ncbi:BMP family ABC transporter substrate-binding protein, partial [Streptomyces sp. McG5]|nr:BMP family ABC transporter substrate-binding protein [Streptomyces sp. McG5]
MATAALGTLALLAVAGCRVDAAAGPGLSPAPPPPATTEAVSYT